MTDPRLSIISNAYSTTYLIEADTEDQVNLAIENIMGRYLPTGYGTQVRKKTKTSTGTFMAEVWRSNSCD